MQATILAGVVPRAKRLALPAATLVPLALAVVFHAIGPRAQSAAPREARPALAFQQYLVNLGKVRPAAEHAALFAFTNSSDRQVTITGLEPSCGCLNPSLAKRHFGPGEHGRFHLRVQTAGERPGPQEYWCIVAYDDPDPRTVIVTFKIDLPEKTVFVEPRSIAVYQLDGQPATYEFTVTDFRPRPLRLLAATCSAEFASVELGPTSLDAFGHRRQKVLVTIGTVDSGRHHVWARVTTDDPAFPTLHIPILVIGRNTSIRPAGLERRSAG